jgi:hypothetical protein
MLPIEMRKTLTLTVTTVLLAACGGAPVATTKSPASSSVASVSAAGASLNCRLPVGGFIPPGLKGQLDNSMDVDGQPSQKGVGGFLQLPSGTYTSAADSDRAYLADTAAWVPVLPRAIAPDQRSYVLARSPRPTNAPPTTSLFLVDVKTKSERLLFAARDGEMAAVLAFNPEGIYVITMSSIGGAGSTELQVIDPATGMHRLVPGAGAVAGEQRIWTAVSRDAAWGMVITNPQQTQTQPPMKLVRLNLNDGSAVDWYVAPGPFIVAGFDGDQHPLLLSFGQSGAANVALVTTPNRLVAVQSTGGSYLGGQGTGVTDTHGTWFGSGDGSVWLYSSARGFEKVASIPPQAGGTGQPYDPHAWRTIAGPCG